MKSTILFCGIVATMVFVFVSCNDVTGPGSSGNPDNTSKKDTSIFIGTWVQIFDTISPGGKEYWASTIFTNVFKKPDTMIFINDSIYKGTDPKDSSFYYYSKDTLYRYTEEKMITKSDTLPRYYRIQNDTLYFSKIDSLYHPFYVRISK